MPTVSSSNELARLLKMARGDMAMRELARRSGLSAAQISRIEAGKVDDPGVETLTRLASALGRDPRYLFVALGRMGGPEAIGLVRAGLAETGDDGDFVQLADRARALGAQHADLENDLSTLGGRYDVLSAEAEDLHKEIEFQRRMVAENLDQPDVAQERESALEEAQQRLETVMADLDGLRRHVADVRRDAGRYASLGQQAQEKLWIEVRRHGARLFLSGAASPLLRVPMGLGLGSDQDGRDTQLAAYVNSIASWVSPSSPQSDGDKDDVSTANAAMDDTLVRLRNLLVHDSRDAEFRQLSAAWNRLSPTRREKVLDFVEDQRRLSIQEQLRDREEVMTFDDPPDPFSP